MTTSPLTARGWNATQSCMTDPSVNCSIWCPNSLNNQIEISLHFANLQFVTGFVLYNVNDSYSVNYHLNITGSGVTYTKPADGANYIMAVLVSGV